MKDKLVSIIIPVYNVEKYVRKCIECVINQTYLNLEIILINDGSTDKSGEICDDYAQKDKRITVYHQQNQGVVCARRKGIEHANGEYICFVDADDTIKADMVEFFVGNIGETDLITSGIDCVNEKGRCFQRFDALPEGKYQTAEKMQYLLLNFIVFEDRLGEGFRDGILPYLCNKMFNTRLMKNVITDVDERIVFGEDRELLIRYVLKASSVTITKCSFYNYIYRENSADSSVNKNFMHNMNYLHCALERAVSGHFFETELIKQIELFTLYRLKSIPIHMGFSSVAQCTQHIFPYINLLEGKKYVLYGAGKVGLGYYRQIQSLEEGKLVLWVDKQWQNLTDFSGVVYPVEAIIEIDYDYILLAVEKKELAEEIKNELINMNISEEKILWKKPIPFRG